MKKLIDPKGIFTTFIGVLLACLSTIYVNHKYNQKLFRDSLDTYFLTIQKSIIDYNLLIDLANKEEIRITDLVEKNNPPILIQDELISHTDFYKYSSSRLINLLLFEKNNVIYMQRSTGYLTFNTYQELIDHYIKIQKEYCRLAFIIYKIAIDNPDINYTEKHYNNLIKKIDTNRDKIKLHKIKL